MIEKVITVKIPSVDHTVSLGFVERLIGLVPQFL